MNYSNHDKILCKIFFIDNWHFNQSYLNKYKRHYKKQTKYQNIINYIEHRYKDSESFKETLYRMNNNIDIRPVCQTCGNNVKFIGKGNRLFALYCSDKCSANNKNTTLKKKQTQLKNWGTENCYDSEKYKELNRKKFGCDFFYQSKEFKQKRKEALIDKYGSSSFNNIDKRKQTSLIKYGVENYSQTDECKQRINKTYINNIKLGKTIVNSSKDELHIFNILKSIYSDVCQYYFDDRYPYKCDFYIPSLDLFIEYNGSQYHHNHPFDENNIEDINELNRLKEKSNEFKNIGKHYNQYDAIIYTWTNLDVKKFNIAKENDLNYLVFYTFTDFKKWVSQIIIERYAKQEYNRIKHIEFPSLYSYKITSNLCLSEFNNLVKHYRSKTNKTSSDIIKKFHKCIIYDKKKKSLSPYDGWQEIKNDFELFKKYYKNRLIYSDYVDKNLKSISLTGELPEYVYGYGLSASGMYPLVSTFKPGLAKYIITTYLKEYKTIFDPFSGYSGRMIGSLACNKNYIGQDINEMSVKESNEIYDFLKPHIKSTALISCKDSIEETGEYECLFTCPPYNDIEQWHNVDLKNYSCDEWIDICLKNYKCKKYVFVTDDKIIKYKNYIVDSIENKSHLSTNQEYIIIINKE